LLSGHGQPAGEPAAEADVGGGEIKGGTRSDAIQFRFARVSEVDGPFGVNLTFGYDGGGNRTSVTDNVGGETDSTFDAADRLSNRSMTEGSVTVSIDITYDAAGNEITRTRTEGSTSAGETDNLYDAGGMITSLITTDGSTTLVDEQYSYDLASRLHSKTVGGVSTIDYTYDPAGQLITAGVDTYGYDPNGVPNTGGLTPGVNNQVSTDGLWTYTYDNAGELIEKSQGASAPTWWYTYDHDGHMTQASYADDGSTVTVVVDYQYDVFGNLVGRTETDSGDVVSDQRFVMDGWDTAKPSPIGNENYDNYADLVSDGDGGWTVATSRMFGASFDEPVVSVTSAGAASWYATDRQGSVESIFDTSGSIAESRVFDPFGYLTSGTIVDLFTFQGGRFDSATSFTLYSDRWYSSVTQQWTSEDPLGLTPGPNERMFVGNGPTNSQDPSGMVEKEAVPVPSPPQQVTAWRQTNKIAAAKLGQLEEAFRKDYILQPGDPEERPGFKARRKELMDAEAAVIRAPMTELSQESINYLKVHGTRAEKVLAGNESRRRFSEKDAEQLGRNEMAAAIREGDVERERVRQVQKQQFLFNMATLFATAPLGMVGRPALGVGFGTATRQTSLFVAREGAPTLAAERAAALNTTAKNLFQKAEAAGTPAAEAAAREEIGRFFKTEVPQVLRENPGVVVDQPLLENIANRSATGPKSLVLVDNKLITVEELARSSGRTVERVLADLGACFVAGTPLLTPHGPKPIEQFHAGDLVLSRDEHDPAGEVGPKVVEAVFRHFARLLTVRASGREVGTTAEHPFWVRGKGWVPARELAPGDVLVGHDNRTVAVEGVVEADEWTEVYNLRVADWHTYFVGCDEWGFSVWAHNACLLPVDPKSAEFARGFRYKVVDGANTTWHTNLSSAQEVASSLNTQSGRLSTIPGKGPTINEFKPGESNFSGVYDPGTGHWHTLPSGTIDNPPRLANGRVPMGEIVPRGGGHGTVEGELFVATKEGIDTFNTVGFTVKHQADGSLLISWDSGVNALNFGGSRAAPVMYRQRIMDAIKQATGKTVKSE
jgi:RHS repeat-associated protein